MTRLLLAGVIAGLMLAACQPAPPADGNAAAAPEVAPAPPGAAGDVAPLGDFKITGILTKVESGAYPMYVLTVDTGDGKEPLVLNFNNEEAKKSPADLDIGSLEGKRVGLDYTRKNELNMLSMKLDGKELLAQDPAHPAPDADSSVTGKLDGVTELTQSDLPDTLTVVDSAGKKYDFEAYVSEAAVVAANGKTVTVGYDTRPREDVTAIAPAP
ncbi:MAG TPA: hypothetical protein VGO52_19255 [Hyphomonadaceae bacterium]|nr:hypothetical protein [Hyphomonadaceae bacterium]